MLFSLFLQAPMTQKFANRLKPLAIAVFLVTISSIPLLFLDGVEKQGWGITWLVFPLAMI
jgi:MFS family permease